MTLADLSPNYPRLKEETMSIEELEAYKEQLENALERLKSQHTPLQRSQSATRFTHIFSKLISHLQETELLD